MATASPVAAKTTLFVAELPTDMDDIENALYRHFGTIGSIVSTKACRDMHTQRLLGHGYVNFQNQADAERALKQLNFSEIAPGKPIRVAWSQRDPAARKMGAGNLFVKDLDDSVTQKILHDAFSALGTVTSCKLSLDEAGNSRHYGFVHFENPAVAEKALQMAQGEQLLVGGKAVNIAPFKRRVERDREMQNVFKNLYVKNLAPEAKAEDVAALLASFEPDKKALTNPPFLHLQAPFDSQFALAEMNSHEGALAAIEALHEKEHPLAIKDGKLYVARALSKKERAAAQALATQQSLLQNQGRNLYVKHLDDSMTDDLLTQLFSPYGTVEKASVSRFPETGQSRGFGFVVFESKDAASAAQRDLHGKMIGSRPLYVAVAQNRDARIKMLEQQSRTRVNAAAMGGMGGLGAPVGPMAGMYGPMGAYGGPGGWGGPAAAAAAAYGALGARGMVPVVPRGPMGPGGVMNPLMGGLGRPPMPTRGMPPGGMMPGRPPLPLGPGFPPMGAFAPPMNMPPGGPMRGAYPGAPMGAFAPIGGAPMRAPRGNQGTHGPGPNGHPGAHNQGGANNGGGQGGSASSGLSLQDLSKMSPEEQKNTLGERLFLQVSAIHAPQAAKITGMLLEMDVSEIIHILEHDSVLRAKVNEALAVLRDYGVNAASS
jgi:polyadenylate-binding protein